MISAGAGLEDRGSVRALMISRGLAVWLAMLVLAVANGTFRAAVLIPRFGEAAGHVLSTVMLCILIAGLTWAAIGWLAPPTPGSAVGLGVLWVILTVGFDFGFGRLAAHKSWQELRADYNVLRGRIWILVLLTTGAAPYLTARLRHLL